MILGLIIVLHIVSSLRKTVMVGLLLLLLLFLLFLRTTSSIKLTKSRTIRIQKTKAFPQNPKPKINPSQILPPHKPHPNKPQHPNPNKIRNRTKNHHSYPIKRTHIYKQKNNTNSLKITNNQIYNKNNKLLTKKDKKDKGKIYSNIKNRGRKNQGR